jgi:hypothetical protein
MIMSKETAVGTVGSYSLGGRAALDRKVGAFPTLAHHPRKASRMRALLKATLVVLAGVSLALALTDPGLAKGDHRLQAPHDETVAASR